jgi:hypothetical protein
MNRHDKRATKATARSAKIDRVVAVHEAGHAVARFLTAADLGFSTNNAISYIEVAPDGAVTKSVDKRMNFRIQATTFGPMLSKEIQELFREECTSLRGLSGRIAFEALSGIITKARSAGLDVNRWLRAKSLISVFGAAAEARYTGKTFSDVFNGYENEGDRRDAIQDCMIAGMTEEEEDDIGAVLDEAAAAAVNLIYRNEVWRALLALADKLPAAGRFEGKKAASIIEHALARADNFD